MYSVDIFCLCDKKKRIYKERIVFNLILEGEKMTYCSKCGKKNEDDSEFCAKCGVSLTDSKKDHEKECEKNCEEECSGGKKNGPPYFFAAIVILFGLWIVFEFVLRKINPMPESLAWVNNFSFWWVFALLVAIMIIASGIRMIMKK